MKRTIPIILVSFGLVLLIFGLTLAFKILNREIDSTTVDSIVDEKSVLRVPLPDNFLELDPRKQLTINLKAISNAVFSRLVRVNSLGEIEPDLAESWSFDLQRQEVILKIRKNVFFHDGSSLSADDVLFSFNEWLMPRAMDNSLLFDVEGGLEYASGTDKAIRGVRKVDSHTIAVKLKKRFTEDFIYALSTPRFYVFKKARTENQDILLGSGPFLFHKIGTKEVSLKRNEKFYGKSTRASEIVFYSVQKSEALKEVLNGKSHVLFAYGDIGADHLDTNTVVKVPMKRTSTGILFFMNQGRGKSEEFRKSVAKIFDRDRLQQDCYPDGLVADRIIPPGLRGSTSRDSEISQSRSPLLVPATLPVLFSTFLQNRCLFKNLSDSYGRHGGKIRELPSLSELYAEFLEGKVDFAYEKLTFKSLDPSNVLQYFNPASAEYFLREEVPELTALFRELGRVETSAQKSNILSLIDNFLVESSFVVPLQHETFYTAHSVNLVGFTQSDFGSIAGVKWEELGLRSAQ